MANQYLELKKKFEDEFSAFPIQFAFSKEQFTEGMKKLGLDPEKDTDKVYTGFSGGFFKKTDADTLIAMLDSHDKQMKAAIAEDVTGEGFLYDMFYYELANHEYGYTRDLMPTLDALGMTLDSVNANPAMVIALQKAIKQMIVDSDNW